MTVDPIVALESLGYTDREERVPFQGRTLVSKLQKGASKARRAQLKAKINGTVADDPELTCEWSENDSSYLVNHLLAFARAQSEEFQKYKGQRLESTSPPRRVVHSAGGGSTQAEKGTSL